MLVEPERLGTERVTDLVRSRWGVPAEDVTYLPEGAGAHHWVVTVAAEPAWVATADVMDEPVHVHRIHDAYAAGAELFRRGHEFATAPVACSSGVFLVPAVAGMWMSLSPYVVGRSGAGVTMDAAQTGDIAEMLGRLHSATPPGRTPSWLPGPPHRAALAAALDDLDGPWRTGPYGELARRAVAEARPGIEERLARYDELAACGMQRQQSWVVTHGEPHTGNVVWSDAGPRLLDWESLRIAPRERDLRVVLDGDRDLPQRYLMAGGPQDPVSADLLELFDLEWQLSEIGVNADRFRRQHTGTPDDDRDFRDLIEEIGASRG